MYEEDCKARGDGKRMTSFVEMDNILNCLLRKIEWWEDVELGNNRILARFEAVDLKKKWSVDNCNSDCGELWLFLTFVVKKKFWNGCSLYCTLNKEQDLHLIRISLLPSAFPLKPELTVYCIFTLIQSVHSRFYIIHIYIMCLCLIELLWKYCWHAFAFHVSSTARKHFVKSWSIFFLPQDLLTKQSSDLEVVSHTTRLGGSHNPMTGIVTPVWRHYVRKFYSRVIDSWVQLWRFDMSNLHSWLWTSITHLLWQKVKCACASHGAQRSACVVRGVCSHDCL